MNNNFIYQAAVKLSESLYNGKTNLTKCFSDLLMNSNIPNTPCTSRENTSITHNHILVKAFCMLAKDTNENTKHGD